MIALVTRAESRCSCCLWGLRMWRSWCYAVARAWERTSACCLVRPPATPTVRLLCTITHPPAPPIPHHSALPQTMFLLFTTLGVLWTLVVVRARADAHKIHFLMIVLVAFKSLTVLSQVSLLCLCICLLCVVFL